MSASSGSALHIDISGVPRAVARVTKRDNILYPLSAFFMLLGCFLIVLPHIYEFLHLAELLALFGVITVYEGMVIATVAYIARRSRDCRDLPVLMFIELLFLLDATFTVNACLPVSRIGGPITVVVALLFAYAKIALTYRLTRLRIFEGVHVFLLPAMAFLYLFQGVFQVFRGAADPYREVSTYLVFLAAGVLVFLLDFVRTQPVATEDERPAWLGPVWRKTVVATALVATGVQLVGQSWVHQVPVSFEYLLPVIFSAVFVWPWPRDRDGALADASSEAWIAHVIGRIAVVASAVLLALLTSPETAWLSPLLVSPLRLGLVYGGCLLAVLGHRHRARALTDAAFVALIMAALGHSGSAMWMGLFDPTTSSYVWYVLAAAAWLASARSYRRLLVVVTPLVIMSCASVGESVRRVDGVIEFLRYWPLVAFGAGLLIRGRDHGFRAALVVVMFAVGLANARPDTVADTTYVFAVLAMFVAAAVVEHKGYAAVAVGYGALCGAYAYGLRLPRTALGWGVLAITAAFVLFGFGVLVSRKRLRRVDEDEPEQAPAFDPTLGRRIGAVAKRALAMLFIAGVVLAVVYPNLPSKRRRYGHCMESSAVASCIVVLAGQATFHKTDFYGKGELVYANPRDGRGFVDLYETPDGREVGLIDRSLAVSHWGGTDKAGYFMVSLPGSVDYGTYDPSIEFAVCLVPAEYNISGRNIFVMDTGGTVYQTIAENIYRDLRDGDPVPPLKLYPSGDELIEKWIAVGSG